MKNTIIYLIRHAETVDEKGIRERISRKENCSYKSSEIQ